LRALLVGLAGRAGIVPKLEIVLALGTICWRNVREAYAASSWGNGGKS
jgi:hypothetical protein